MSEISNLTVSIDRIPSGGRPLSAEMGIEWLYARIGRNPHRVEGPISVQCTVSASGTGYLAVGGLSVPMAFACTRCLQDVQATIAAEFTHFFEPVEASSNAGDDEVGVTRFEGLRIDLAPLVTEELILALPTYPLCDEECKGLCAGCGLNLNRVQCTCEHKPDSRWDKLRLIKLDSG